MMGIDHLVAELQQARLYLAHAKTRADFGVLRDFWVVLAAAGALVGPVVLNLAFGVSLSIAMWLIFVGLAATILAAAAMKWGSGRRIAEGERRVAELQRQAFAAIADSLGEALTPPEWYDPSTEFAYFNPSEKGQWVTTQNVIWRRGELIDWRLFECRRHERNSDGDERTVSAETVVAAIGPFQLPRIELWPQQACASGTLAERVSQRYRLVDPAGMIDDPTIFPASVLQFFATEPPMHWVLEHDRVLVTLHRNRPEEFLEAIGLVQRLAETQMISDDQALPGIGAPHPSIPDNAVRPAVPTRSHRLIYAVVHVIGGAALLLLGAGMSLYGLLGDHPASSDDAENLLGVGGFLLLIAAGWIALAARMIMKRAQPMDWHGLRRLVNMPEDERITTAQDFTGFLSHFFRTRR